MARVVQVLRGFAETATTIGIAVTGGFLAQTRHDEPAGALGH
ncbi:hypothetical protein F4558_002934 [Micromonospora profundi]|nr:hypothetical protein [Micromonospora profundi]